MSAEPAGAFLEEVAFLLVAKKSLGFLTVGAWVCPSTFPTAPMGGPPGRKVVRHPELLHAGRKRCWALGSVYTRHVELWLRRWRPLARLCGPVNLSSSESEGRNVAWCV